jgi:4-alpha-glucanotransferase
MKIRVLLGISLMLFSCRTKQEFHLNFSKMKPCTLRVNNFQWALTSIENGYFSGDFKKLDHAIYDFLKKENDFCQVIIIQPTIPITDSLTTNVGQLNLTALRKYKNWRDWHEKAGLLKLIRSTYFITSISSTGVKTYSLKPLVDSAANK